jgi:HK97 family phage prohead protease
MKHGQQTRRATMQTSAPRSLVRAAGETDSRSICVVATDGTRDLMGDILEPEGGQFDQFRRNPIVLAQHQSDQPIARVSHIMLQRGQVLATIQFPPAYVNPQSDQYLALMKADILCAVSVGFLPLEYEPLPDYSGFRYTSWILLELSVCSVPANPNALVIGKSLRSGASFAARRAADLETAAAIRRRFNQTVEPPSAKIAHARAEDVRIREIQAGNIAANRAAVSWW